MPEQLEILISEHLQGLTVFDLLVITAIVIVWPVYSYIELKRHSIEKLREDPNLRLHSYNLTMAQLWGLTIAIMAIWLWAERPLAQLGFRHELDLPTIVAWGAAGVFILFSASQLLLVMTHEGSRTKLAQQLSEVGELTSLLMPRTGQEYRRSMGVSITAGIAEEIIFRGYLIWVFSLFIHPWIAGALSVCVFVFLHRYQSKAGLIQVALFAVVSTVMILASGSLWPVIVMHVLVDMLNISLGWKVGQHMRANPDPAS